MTSLHDVYIRIIVRESSVFLVSEQRIKISIWPPMAANVSVVY